ncbi:hypothetical protein LEP1GSC124_2466 [Leptospira interrogans serovar Pyrogenes str. 200701872]|uniref:Uncharacterized protein n=1 Tax=Leptospira interrogans serovar Pyrogenes str. 200701872 TaxID=1193029 RepID=M6ZK93_LEPIR|nr:hypothetical protein LEP1GSC124_2466 [Leptospira interrogans serovar Pyrogenes str. 200701872]
MISLKKNTLFFFINKLYKNNSPIKFLHEITDLQNYLLKIHFIDSFWKI